MKEEFIDVSLVIKSEGTPKPFTKEEAKKGRVKMGKKRRPNTTNVPKREFDIGGGSEMVLSSQVLLILKQEYPEKNPFCPN